MEIERCGVRGCVGGGAYLLLLVCDFATRTACLQQLDYEPCRRDVEVNGLALGGLLRARTTTTAVVSR